MRNLEAERETMNYLNNAAMARLSPDVLQVGVHAITHPLDPPATDMVPSIRRDFATLIGAPDGEGCIAITPSTAFSITLAAHNLSRQWEASSFVGKVLVLQDQMCSAVYPWQEICDSSNGRISLEVVPYPNFEARETWTQLILERLDSKILAVCLPPLHWSDGALVDLVAVGDACVDRGNIPFIVDATQGAGAIPLSVKEIRPLLLACSVHKWLRGPSGVCLVYLHPSLHDSWTPLDQNGRGRDVGSADWDAFSNTMGPAGYPTPFFRDARKFDSGGKPNPIILPMLKKSLRTIVALDMVQLQEALKGIMQPLMDWVQTAEQFIVPSEHGFHLLGLRPKKEKNIPTEQILEMCRRLLEDFGIYVTVRCGALRISPYIDNTQEDIEAFVMALKAILTSFEKK
jgi:selenocysteine lyase/cysteine desulfurase